MANGYAGKILLVNLTAKSTSTIDTAKYDEFAGGVGMGAAIFWDLAVTPGDWDLQDAFDPRNVISLMTGPLAATGAPGSGRTSVCSIAPETFPTPLFHRSSLGGRFGTMLKQAGWDGVVVQGKADRPVWINIINDKVTVEDAKLLWGLNTLKRRGKFCLRSRGEPVSEMNGIKLGKPIRRPGRRLYASAPSANRCREWLPSFTAAASVPVRAGLEECLDRKT